MVKLHQLKIEKSSKSKNQSNKDKNKQGKDKSKGYKADDFVVKDHSSDEEKVNFSFKSQIH